MIQYLSLQDISQVHRYSNCLKLVFGFLLKGEVDISDILVQVSVVFESHIFLSTENKARVPSRESGPQVICVAIQYMFDNMHH